MGKWRLFIGDQVVSRNVVLFFLFWKSFWRIDFCFSIIGLRINKDR